MYCPKCGSEMEYGILAEMRVDRCLQCLGIWFRNAAHEHLKKVKGSELIDIGPADLGKEFDKAGFAACPDCHEPMERVSDPSQPHIRYESCPAGHGVFFDAGEYRDYKEKTLGDLFKRKAPKT